MAPPLPGLILPCDRNGPHGFWATFNNKAGYACSPDGYLLTIAPPKYARLKDMSPLEEKDFWDFTFTLATEGIQNPENRGSIHSRPLRESFVPCHVAIGINDGFDAGQSVGAVHTHIIWAGPENPVFNMDTEESLAEQRGIIAGKDEPYYSHASLEIRLTHDHYAEQIRDARRLLGEEFSLSNQCSFSIYTKHTCAADPRDDTTLVVESWTTDHPSIISVSDAFRAFSGIRPLKKYASPQGLTYSHFLRAP